MNVTKKIAELCWYYKAWSSTIWHCEGRRKGPKCLARHLNISEDAILAIMRSDAYLKEVENLIRTTRSPEDIKKWIASYKGEMPKKFGETMGLSEEVVSELIKRY